MLKSYCQRVYYLALFQLTLACLYLLVLYCLRDFMLMPYTILSKMYPVTHSFPVVKGSEKVPIGRIDVTHNIRFRNTDRILFEFNFWMALNATRALLHIVSSTLLLWATIEETPKLCTIKLCNWTLKMNWGFLLYEILVLFILYFEHWQLGIAFVLYRILFIYQVDKLVIILETFI